MVNRYYLVPETILLHLSELLHLLKQLEVKILSRSQFCTYNINILFVVTGTVIRSISYMSWTPYSLPSSLFLSHVCDYGSRMFLLLVFQDRCKLFCSWFPYRRDQIRDKGGKWDRKREERNGGGKSRSFTGWRRDEFQKHVRQERRTLQARRKNEQIARNRSQSETCSRGVSSEGNYGSELVKEDLGVSDGVEETVTSPVLISRYTRSQ